MAGYATGWSARQTGATLAEFLLVTPIVMLVGMATVQAGLVYHGKTTLNYATFEAARSGAVNHARLSMMRKELGLRLAPLQGGDGSADSALIAIAKSRTLVEDKRRTQLRVLNPTTAAFDDWGISSTGVSGRVLPNNHLRHREHTVGDRSGLSLRDANLLKIEVTHGMSLNVPVVASLFSKAMMVVDPENSHYYQRNQFPLKSVATVRMQSEAWEEEVVLGSQVLLAEPVDEVSSGSIPESGQYNPTHTDASSETSEDTCDAGEHGLGSSPVLIDVAVVDQQQCGVLDEGYGVPQSGDGFGCN